VIRFGEESVALDEILRFRSAMNDSVFWMIIASCMHEFCRRKQTFEARWKTVL